MHNTQYVYLAVFYHLFKLLLILYYHACGIYYCITWVIYEIRFLKTIQVLSSSMLHMAYAFISYVTHMFLQCSVNIICFIVLLYFYHVVFIL